MAASGSGTAREEYPQVVVADRISQAVLSTSNLLHIMQESSPSQAHLMKLPRNLWAKVSMIKNTGQVLEQLPQVISSLDAYMENSLHSAPQLETVTQLLSHMENSQLKYAFPTSWRGEEQKDPDSGKIAEVDTPSESVVSSSGSLKMPRPT